ncbi:hypothetical protein [Desulforhopalus sp. IMCC35007]|uniref:hypothetical protein n=1 Tax=Desulforhopalus sp. IMCC35007 TaxID=2569543 RepID=UPI0010ADF3D5|nr:hypothetical protein [Desulforhopalus sp. IMCC35007]TKB07462.1 hypothetical protein FCL48_17120 [Desulforhopalus sp. IMCC35007]
MNISTIDKVLRDSIGEIIKCACVKFKQNSEYKEDRLTDNESDICLRDHINELLSEKFQNAGIVWGKTANPQQPEISFRDLLKDNSESYLPNNLGGIDLIISPNKPLIKGLATQEFEDANLFYSGGNLYLKGEHRDIFNSSVICVEVKVLHYKKHFGYERYCNESEYFLTGKHWEPKEKNLRKYAFDPHNPSHKCSGQLLSDVARGAYLLGKQNDIERLYLVGVIIGEGDGSVIDLDGNEVRDSCACISERIYDLINCLKEVDDDHQGLGYMHYGKLKAYTPSLSIDLDQKKLDIEVHVHPVESYDNNTEEAVSMYPYHIVLSKVITT